MAVLTGIGLKIKEPPKKYPKIMVAGKESLVYVLFIRSGEGTVVGKTGETCYEIGLHDTDWVMSDFEDFNRIITLQNE